MTNEMTYTSPAEAQEFKRTLEARYVDLRDALIELNKPEVFGNLSDAAYNRLYASAFSELNGVTHKLMQVCKDFNWDSKLLPKK